MARPFTHAKEKFTVNVRADLLAAVREKQKDPLYGKTGHGAMSALIESLLFRWLEAANKADATLTIKLEDI